MHVDVIAMQIVAALYVFDEHPDPGYHFWWAAAPLQLSIQGFEVGDSLLELQGSLPAYNTFCSC